MTATAAALDVAPRWHVIGRAFHGWTALGLSVSGAASYSEGETLAQYLPDAIEGALIYDGECSELRTLSRLVIDGPRLDVTLKAGSSVSKAWPLHRLRTTESRPEWEGLARVAPDVYAGLLRSVKGVRVGVVRAGAVRWDGGA